MAIVPIRNLGGGGGSATSKFYIVKKGISNFLIKNFTTYTFSKTEDVSNEVCKLIPNNVGQTCYTKFDLTVDTSKFTQLHFVARGTESGGRISSQATDNNNVSTWTNEVRLTTEFAEYTLTANKSILFYSGAPTIEIKSMWLT